MSECIDCGIKLAMLNSMPNGRCKKCHGVFLSSQIDTEALHTFNSNNIADKLKQERALEELERAKRKLAAAVLLTTETAPQLAITKRVDIITSQAAFEINNFKDVFVGLLNPVQGRSNEMERQLDNLRLRSLENLRIKAHGLGANGVVAVDIDISTVTIGQISMLMMVASGTAVIVGDS